MKNNIGVQTDFYSDFYSSFLKIISCVASFFDVLHQKLSEKYNATRKIDSL